MYEIEWRGKGWTTARKDRVKQALELVQAKLNKIVPKIALIYPQLHQLAICCPEQSGQIQELYDKLEHINDTFQDISDGIASSTENLEFHIKSWVSGDDGSAPTRAWSGEGNIFHHEVDFNSTGSPKTWETMTLIANFIARIVSFVWNRRW